MGHLGRDDSPAPQELYGTVLFADLPVDEDVETDVFRVNTAAALADDLDQPSAPVSRDAPWGAAPPLQSPRAAWIGGSVVGAALLVAGCLYLLA